MSQNNQDLVVNSDVKREIQKHHKSLKQFIQVSYDSNAPVRKNSKRANKAHEKLLKLSLGQFVELSTDVYDELHRRINESREEPDHLLPKDIFHPKRNQAREKLASLPAQRFKDLVSDILFDIERRYLHIPDSPIVEREINNFNNVDANEAAKLAAQHGVQSKTVIPTKATMAWSSDEEDEEEVISPHRVSRPQSYINGDDPTRIHNEKRDTVPEMKSISSPTTNKHTSSSSIKRGLSINKDREIQMLLEEGTKMDVKITDLEKNLEQERERVAQLEKENESLQRQIDSNKERFNTELSQLTRELNDAPNKNEVMLLKSQYDALQSSHGIINDKHLALTEEYEKLKNTQSTREIVPQYQPGESILDDSQIKELQDQLNKLAKEELKPLNDFDKNDVETSTDIWKKRYEQARSDFIFEEINKADISEALFQDFVSGTGVINMKKLAEFRVAVESFYLEVGKGKRDDVFKSVSMVATTADDMCSDVAGENKLVSTLRSCISHMIIVARHYLTFNHILPVVVLHIAVNDVSLAICDLIKSVKLSTSNKEKDLPIQQNEVSTPAMKEVEPPSSFFDKDDLSSPVRPLRMIERMNSPNPSNGKFGDNAVFEKRLAIANSPLAPITTQVASESTANGTLASIASPRGPGIISLANKYGSSATTANKNGNSHTSPKASPTSLNILDRMKKFESPEQETTTQQIKSKIPEMTSSTDGFAKFGARRRSSVTDNVPSISVNEVTAVKELEVEESNSTSKSPHDINSTNVDLNEIPVHESDIRIEKEIKPLSTKSNVTKSKDLKEQLSDIEYDKTVAAANFNVEEFNITNPDNTLHELLLYLEHQTMDVISTIQTLLASIKKLDSTRGVLRDRAKAINVVVGQMTEATNISMSQTRNVQLREHGSWVVQNLEDCGRRMDILCGPNNKTSDTDYADKNFKQRLAGVAFDIAKSTKELVKSVEELSLKQDIQMLDARLNN